ncbi:MAG: tRNA (N(6)-L-threonylcarbamoyladenosine(37)-C(2))-methylthiotransferase MtaB, partial [Bacilli bacterium]|nr:tRNA (N(6)-L-threonylcarbamoyladenosine(37)-C(2))-methylthiotransferase MtaB [Bacilli bacterium]
MKYKIYTLGCKVNEYESEVMENLLDAAGYEKSDDPDICIINTCTVTNQADSKSRKLIRSVKRNNPDALIIAVGCMIQNKIDTLEEMDIDIALGNKDKSKIVSYIENYKDKTSAIYDIEQMEFEDMSLSNSDLTRAYIKIQDGCDNYCAFCVIPYVRGHVRCKKFDKVIEEAKHLIVNGHKEIVLTGIHTGNYHDNTYDLSDLLARLSKLDGLERLRISSIEITELNDKFLQTLNNSKVLTNHMHIPLQSGSDRVLKTMNRKYDVKYFIDKINKIRNIRPGMNITTDVIVGFPGETDEMFMETIETIKTIGFSKLHVFPYSKREGTKAAAMKNQINGNIKKERVRTLIDLSKELEIKYMNKFLNL